VPDVTGLAWWQSKSNYAVTIAFMKKIDRERARDILHYVTRGSSLPRAVWD
jgi:hypothetical protein